MLIIHRSGTRVHRAGLRELQVRPEPPGQDGRVVQPQPQPPLVRRRRGITVGPPSVEWYYPALKHGATHAAINRTTARAVVEALDQRRRTNMRGCWLVRGECKGADVPGGDRAVRAARRRRAPPRASAASDKWGAVLAENGDRRGHRGRRARARAPPLVLPERQRRRKYVGARRHALHKQRRGAVASSWPMVGAAVKTRDTSSHGASVRTDKPEAVRARVGAAPAQAAPKSSSATAPGSSSSCDRWPRPYPMTNRGKWRRGWTTRGRVAAVAAVQAAKDRGLGAPLVRGRIGPSSSRSGRSSRGRR